MKYTRLKHESFMKRLRRNVAMIAFVVACALMAEAVLYFVVYPLVWKASHQAVLRVEIHLCYAPGCPRPPDFLVGGKSTPMCKGHYDLHKAVEHAEFEAWSRAHDRWLRGEG